MGHPLDVRVLDADGDPLEGLRVRVVIDAVKREDFEEYTDEEGHAVFETAADYEPSTELTIFVKGKPFGPYEIDDGAYVIELEARER